MSKILAVIIPADEEQGARIVDYDRANISFIQDAVGGYFDVVDSEVHQASIWHNDEGKIHGLPINRRVTLMLWLESRWREVDYIAGDALITGVPDDDGNTTSVPESVLDALGGMYTWKIQVQTVADGDEWSGNQMRYANYFDAVNAACSLAMRWAAVTDIRVVRA